MGGYIELRKNTVLYPTSQSHLQGSSSAHSPRLAFSPFLHLRIWIFCSAGYRTLCKKEKGKNARRRRLQRPGRVFWFFICCLSSPSERCTTWHYKNKKRHRTRAALFKNDFCIIYVFCFSPFFQTTSALRYATSLRWSQGGQGPSVAVIVSRTLLPQVAIAEGASRDYHLLLFFLSGWRHEGNRIELLEREESEAWEVDIRFSAFRSGLEDGQLGFGLRLYQRLGPSLLPLTQWLRERLFVIS